MLSRLVCIAIGLSLMAGCATVPARSSARPILGGYVPVHSLATTAARTDLGAFTHLYVAFANPDAQGALVASAGNMTCMGEASGQTLPVETLDPIIAAGHRAGAKVILSVGGGWIPPCAGDWATLLHGAGRDEMVRTLVAFVDRTGLDGVDLDIEGELLTRIDRAGDYTPFVAALADALHRRGKLLTCATGSYEGGMIPAASIPWFDLVQVMAYDVVGLTWGEPGDEHAPMSQATHDMALWRARGVPRERLVLGTPFYGYGFGALRGNYGYRDIVARHGERMQGDVVGERCGGCDYITFNGVETLQRKARLGRSQGAGVMVWEVSEDTDDGVLTRTLADALGSSPSD